MIIFKPAKKDTDFNIIKTKFSDISGSIEFIFVNATEGFKKKKTMHFIVMV